jgi:hypothetical protein
MVMKPLLSVGVLIESSGGGERRSFFLASSIIAAPMYILLLGSLANYDRTSSMSAQSRKWPWWGWTSPGGENATWPSDLFPCSSFSIL